MEIGSRVKVIDGSWSLKLDNKEFKHAWGIDLANREFEVLNINMKLPSYNYEEKFKEDIFNDTVIKDINNNEIVFIQERLLREIQKPREISVDIRAKINQNDINEIKNIIKELEHRIHNLKVQISL